MEKQRNVESAGLGIIGVLTIVLIVLKLLHIIEWSWVLVLLPAFIGLTLKILLIIIAILIVFLGTKKGRKCKK